MQRAAGMFSVPIVHGHPRLRVAGVEEVSKKEHLLALGYDLEAYACEECVAAALGDGAIGEAGGDSGSEGVRVTAALAITVGSILVTVVLVVDGVDGLLPSTFLCVVPSNGQGKMRAIKTNQGSSTVISNGQGNQGQSRPINGHHLYIVPSNLARKGKLTPTHARNWMLLPLEVGHLWGEDAVVSACMRTLA
jgi:hypothetical protein